MKSKSPKYRKAPTPEELELQQKRMADLLALEDWTKEPTLTPLERPREVFTPEPTASPSTPPLESVEAPLKPWDVSEKEMHPYHLIMSERLFQKIDFTWKRNGSRSMRAFVLETLEDAVDEYLKNIGEI